MTEPTHKSYGVEWKDAIDMNDGGHTIAYRSFLMILLLSLGFIGGACLVIFDWFPVVMTR
jgi:hypothetical protein